VTHEHLMAQEGLRNRRGIFGDAEIMGHPDKPGDDDL
jgi:hypothetical protein